MSISLCPYCDNFYDQDYNAEHEEECGDYQSNFKERMREKIPQTKVKSCAYCEATFTANKKANGAFGDYCPPCAIHKVWMNPWGRKDRDQELGRTA